MTVARLTKRRNKLEGMAVEVMADLMGMTLPAVAEKYGVKRQSLYAFVVRHQSEIDDLHARTTAKAEDWQIADKVWRVGEYESLYKTAKAEIDLAEDTYGKVAAVKAASGALRAVAEELGALPRPDQNINVKAMMLIREIGGTDIDVS